MFRISGTLGRSSKSWSYLTRVSRNFASSASLFEAKRRNKLLVRAAALGTGTCAIGFGARYFFGRNDDYEIDYSNLDYWEWRYERHPEPFDWFGTFEELGCWIERVAKRSDRILHVGCGTSILSEQLFDAGFLRTCNVDSSAVCIEAMKKRNQTERPKMEWLQADARDMKGKLSDGAFDVVIEKSTLDAICDCEHALEAHRYIDEVARVLRDGGTFLVFSLAPPNSRRQFLKKHFTYKVEILHEQRCFVYICTKLPAV